MILVSKSNGICGGCGEQIEMEWDLDLVDSQKKAEGIELFCLLIIDTTKKLHLNI